VIDHLDGAVAVVTGAGSGIGRACAVALAAHRSNVVVSDVNVERAAATAQIISAAGGSAHAIGCDVTSDTDVEGLRQAALAQYRGIDIVVNNVGVIAAGAPENLPLSAWSHTLDVNVVSIARALRVFLPGLLSQGRGHIVNTASTSALWAYGYDRLPYSASKAAVLALSESLALYTRPRGVGVTCLCPGPVRTGIAEHITVYGAPQPIRPPALALIEPAQVGRQVVEAIQSDTFFLVTHDEVHDIVRRRAEDIDAFVRAQISTMEGP
jgi:NAD(P)-dependent dehydrogenase (short-subunit alcohol dehydrogenase family)